MTQNEALTAADARLILAAALSGPAALQARIDRTPGITPQNGRLLRAAALSGPAALQQRLARIVMG